jgi:GNAT superfamily N-acetyltransferase
MDLDIRPLTAELGADFLGFFDRDAFADNPAWAGCYCMFFHCGGGVAEWDAATPAGNRASAAARIAAGVMRGHLAYADGQVVGWCHTTPAADLPGLPVFLGVTPEVGVGCVTCFVVAQRFRRRCVARALLDAAIAGFAREGLGAVEAFPRRHSDDDAHHFPGPLALYQQAGFRVIGETPAVVTRLRVRLDLPAQTGAAGRP